MVEASPKMQKYFDVLKEQCKREHSIASAARKKGYDPYENVEVQLAENMAERVVGLIAIVAPQIVGSGISERILELEKKYGALDFRVAMIIAKEVAQEKYCKFDTKIFAIETGIRIGFAYGTVGVVSSPLEGLINVEIKKRRDGKGEYFCLNYGGPIRNAGGTAAAWSVIIADYVRKQLGYGLYDPDENEIKRCHAELEDYHERVANLQYFPSKRESEFMLTNIPVEISGDASDDVEVSNYKDLPRVLVNKVRSGFCLLHSSCIPLKAPKLWKQLSKWGPDLEMEQWNFLKEFIHIQHEEKAKGGKQKKETSEDEPKISPIYTYISDLVAGRPVLGHPLANGSFRLRYGRSRHSGMSAQSINPATMHVLNDFIAIGTQLKVERPGKGAAFTPCDTIDGPIVKLEDDSVVRLYNEEEALKIKKEVKEILYLGDVLVNYGDFFDRAHPLVPVGYCEEWWVQELEKQIVNDFGSLDMEKIADYININVNILKKILNNALKEKPTADHAIILSKKLKTYLHPYWTYFWNSLSIEKFKEFLEYYNSSEIIRSSEGVEKIIFSINENKRHLEILGIPHKIEQGKIIIEKEHSKILFELLKNPKIEETKEYKSTTELINSFSEIQLRDKCGTFIGGRMGRPEKAKMRKMQGSPHGLFPVGEEGGRLRSFQAAMNVGKIKANFPIQKCKCGNDTVFSICEKCGEKTKTMFFSRTEGMIDEQKEYARPFIEKEIPINDYIISMKKLLKINVLPDLIKGVRGTLGREHTLEHLSKAILRAKHELAVNKDGTIRYDCSELPVTHFKTKEIGISVEKVLELGYDVDIKGKPIENEEQIIEIKPQDLIIPCCTDALEEPADEILFRETKFIDELLERLYGLPAYYNLKTKKDLAGQLVIGLAPHTSAGSLLRIIGFSNSQAFLSHYLMHAAMRRDCDGDESCFFLLLDAFLNFSRKFLPRSRGSTMDAPLVLTSILTPGEVDDMAFNVDTVWKYPLELYEAAEQFKKPWDVKVEILKDRLKTPGQYEGGGFTHDTSNYNSGVYCSSYKTLPSMQDKMKAQMNLAKKIRAVDEDDVARLVIEKHFIRDIKGNLRKFSLQQFRCVACNEKYRRPPLVGKCTKCGGKIIFTISEGSIVKYMQPCLDLDEHYKLPTFLSQSLKLLKLRIEGVFGREKEKQEGLGKFF